MNHKNDAYTQNGTPVSTVTRINRRLAKAGYGFRLVRGRGYYWLFDVEGSVAAGMPCQSIYTYSLTPADFDYALGEVNDLLRQAGLTEIAA